MKLKQLVNFLFCVALLSFGYSCDTKDNKDPFDDDVPSGGGGGNVMPPVVTPEYVDLGLSVKWATFNVGATKPEEFGDYFAWGETEPYYELMNESDTVWKLDKPEGYAWSSYKYSKDGKLTKYCNDSNDGYNGYVDTLTILEPDDDVAHVKWGDKWRMPSSAEFEELLCNCTKEYITVKQGEVYCWKLTSKIPGYTDKFILLPAAGCIEGQYRLADGIIESFYWTNTLNHNYWCFEPYDGTNDFWGEEHNYPRYKGLSVRPVYDNGTHGGGSEKPDTTIIDDKLMSAVEQKIFMEDVSQQFLRIMDNDEFHYLIDFARDMDDLYGDYDWDIVEDWADDIFEASKSYIGESSEQKVNDRWNYIVKYFYSDYRILLLLSNFTGHFTARNERWNYTDATDLQFIFKDKEGRNCNLSLTSSGRVTEVRMPSDKDYTGSDYMGQRDGYDIYYDYYDRFQYVIGVPENVTLSLTRGNETMIEITASFDVSALTTDGYFDLAKGNAGVRACVSLSNGFKVVLDNTSYRGNSNAATACYLYKNSDMLLSVQASLDMSGFPSLVLSDDGMDFFEDYFDDEIEKDDSNIKNVYLQVNLLDSIQVVGRITDARKTIDYLDKADSYEDDEDSFKEYVRKANENVQIGVFYHKKPTCQAIVKLDCFYKENYYHGGYWYYEPVMVFSDGSKSSSLPDFFDERDFKNLINSFESLMERYEDMVDY